MVLSSNGAAGREVLPPSPQGLKPKALGGSSQAGLAAQCPLPLSEVTRLIYSFCPGYTLPSVCQCCSSPPAYSTILLLLACQSPQQVHPLTFSNAVSLNAPVSSLTPPKSSSTYHTHILLTYLQHMFSVLCHQISKGLTWAQLPTDPVLQLH